MHACHTHKPLTLAPLSLSGSTMQAERRRWRAGPRQALTIVRSCRPLGGGSTCGVAACRKRSRSGPSSADSGTCSSGAAQQWRARLQLGGRPLTAAAQPAGGAAGNSADQMHLARTAVSSEHEVPADQCPGQVQKHTPQGPPAGQPLAQSGAAAAACWTACLAAEPGVAWGWKQRWPVRCGW